MFTSVGPGKSSWSRGQLLYFVFLVDPLSVLILFITTKFGDLNPYRTMYRYLFTSRSTMDRLSTMTLF